VRSYQVIEVTVGSRPSARYLTAKLSVGQQPSMARLSISLHTQAHVSSSEDGIV
jgi:hypothetical protein